MFREAANIKADRDQRAELSIRTFERPCVMEVAQTMSRTTTTSIIVVIYSSMGAFAKLRTATISFVISVCQSVRAPPTERIFIKCVICVFFEHLSRQFLHLSLLSCSVGSSVHCLKAVLSRASLFISAKVFPFLLATSITQSSQVLLGLPLPLLFSLLASIACFGFL